jgi:hypothetical protein
MSMPPTRVVGAAWYRRRGASRLSGRKSTRCRQVQSASIVSTEGFASFFTSSFLSFPRLADLCHTDSTAAQRTFAE